MAFQKGNQAAKGHKRGTPWADALRIAVNEAAIDGKKGKKLRQIADKVVSEAMEGNVQAIKEIGERLDGKAPQPVEADVTGGLTIEVVKFADTDPE